MNQPGKMNIGTIDIETLSLSMNAAIIEIGMLVSVVDVVNWKPNYTQCADSSVGFYSRLDFLEQLELGRRIDTGTIAFHVKTFGAGPFRSSLYGSPASEEGGSAMVSYAKEALLHLKTACKDLDELWTNHPTFDSGRLHTLSEQLGIGQLWDYRIERDICTLRKSMGLSGDESVKGDTNLVRHTALGDCHWNMSILRAFGYFIED